MHDVVAVKPLGGYKLWLRFDDGKEGELDLKPFLHSFEKIFAPLERFDGRMASISTPTCFTSA